MLGEWNDTAARYIISKRRLPVSWYSHYFHGGPQGGHSPSPPHTPAAMIQPRPKNVHRCFADSLQPGWHDGSAEQSARSKLSIF